MSSRTFFIGDVHGCSHLLRAMLSFVEDKAGRDGFTPQVIFLGDIVDRGIDSLGSMEAVHSALAKWPTSALMLANHDDMFLDVVENRASPAKRKFWVDQCGGWQTCASYCASGEADDAVEVIGKRYPHHVGMLRRAEPLLQVGAFTACHAGINGWLPLDRQDRHDLMWITDGFLDRADDRMPPVIHGHTRMGDRPVVTENRISIDTGAYETGRLTAFFLDRAERRYEFYQATTCGVGRVSPVVHDRGRGCLLDRMDELLTI